MHINVTTELDYKNTGPQNVPANSTQEIVFPAPEGWTAISWGFTSVHPVLEFQELGFALNAEGKQVFRATVRNPSATDRPVRFTFLLMKV